ncbi:splicing factor 3B subunit 1-like [Dorcoceras hygrometricum]|uniref:Splicing factor 3B subunit 1-like n=1 Tax=Dorcoceras hygrometricum TaxID=472368 RepID=A0A2Z7A965_9LAMI|nr:splicing factor 3B subunit 1-like [Dorcoceras hygrometricum]
MMRMIILMELKMNSRKLESFTTPKQFLKEPLKSGEDDDMSGSKKPSKIIEMEKESEKDKEIELVTTNVLSLAKSVATMIDSEDTEPLSKVLELIDKSKSYEESMSIEEILKQIPEGMMLPSLTTANITRIKFGRGIEIPGVNDGDWYKANLPRIATLDKGKRLLLRRMKERAPGPGDVQLICADIDFLVQLREYVIADVVSFFHSFSFEQIIRSSFSEILKQIPEGMMLPSLTTANITRIKFGRGIEIPGVNDGDWYKANLPRIATLDKGKAALVAKDERKGHPAREMFS